MTRFFPQTNRELCQLAHTAAIRDSAPYAIPAYRKRDLDLRKRAYFKGKTELSDSSADLLEQLSQTTSTQDGDAWFEKRWILGEEDAVRVASERIANETNQLGTFGLKLQDSYELTASAAIRWSLASESTVLVAMNGSAYHTLLAGVAGQARSCLP